MILILSFVRGHVRGEHPFWRVFLFCDDKKNPALKAGQSGVEY
jgi:hypothetical protein